MFRTSNERKGDTARDRSCRWYKEMHCISMNFVDYEGKDKELTW